MTCSWRGVVLGGLCFLIGYRIGQVMPGSNYIHVCEKGEKKRKRKSTRPSTWNLTTLRCLIMESEIYNSETNFRGFLVTNEDARMDRRVIPKSQTS
ncbi:hypothetical protein F4775DRAFT_421394 [Biscogniauxia sp. FL1348]|nr:hypothetical protein F4775DRAFT_421394 [Biscogniauxia sp. FL1348]